LELNVYGARQKAGILHKDILLLNNGDGDEVRRINTKARDHLIERRTI
jgi:hypothetical protein